jgi:hypothetical protein
LRGSRECFHSSSCIERFADVSIWPLGLVTVSLALQWESLVYKLYS